MSPAFLNFGRHSKPVKSLRRSVEGDKEIEKCNPKLSTERMRRLDALRDLVARHIDEVQMKQARVYNRGKRDVRFQVGDRMLCKAHWLSSAADKFNAKLAPKYEKPYTIINVLSPIVYEMERGVNESRKKTKAHVS